MLKDDGTFTRLLHGIPYRVVSISPWTAATGNSQLGTVVDIQLDSPLTATTRLPGVRFSPEGTAYGRLMIPVNVTGATTMTLLVDLHSKQVVSAMPPDSTLSRAPGTVDLYPAPGGPNGS